MPTPGCDTGGGTPTHQRPERFELLEAFRFFDANGDDMLSKQEFKDVLTKKEGEAPLSQAQFESLLARIDTDGKTPRCACTTLPAPRLSLFNGLVVIS